ncbi:MAG: hypothetical protein RLN72_12765 [Henriciella sp.]
MRKIILGICVSLFTCAATAQGRPADRGPPAHAGAAPIAGSYISRFVSETIYTPNSPGGIPCPVLITIPNSGLLTCESAQTLHLTPDGTIVTYYNPQNAPPGTSAVGTWTANTRSTYQSKTVSVRYDANGNVAGWLVVKAQSTANQDYSGSQGTFESLNYTANQDPLDPNTVAPVRTTGTFVTQRVQ